MIEENAGLGAGTAPKFEEKTIGPEITADLVDRVLQDFNLRAGRIVFLSRADFLEELGSSLVVKVFWRKSFGRVLQSMNNVAFKLG